MERLQRLSRLWNWLPAFRAVAEHCHLPTAARAIYISAPALSRAVKLLERDLGANLFRRVGRGIELTDAGSHFLDALRTAMRSIDEATQQLAGQHLDGPVHIASAGAITTAVLVPALAAMRRDHPRLLPRVSTPTSNDIALAIRRGQIDICFHGVDRSLQDVADLRTAALGAIRNSVYCGRGHPLFGRRGVAHARLLRHAFVAPPLDTAGRPLDGWPADVTRIIALEVDQLRVGLEICLQGDLLAVLPQWLAERRPVVDGLWRLPFPGITDDAVFATRRQPLATPTRADIVLDYVERVLASPDAMQQQGSNRAAGSRREASAGSRRRLR